MIIREDFTYIAEVDGVPQAMMVTLPNINEIIKDFDGKMFPFGFLKLLWRLKIKPNFKTVRVPLMGVRKEYQNTTKQYEDLVNKISGNLTSYVDRVNPKNQYLNKEYKKTKKTLKNFKKNTKFYYWYRVKKEAQIIAKQRNKKESLNYITAEFTNIGNKYLQHVTGAVTAINENKRRKKWPIQVHPLPEEKATQRSTLQT